MKAIFLLLLCLGLFLPLHAQTMLSFTSRGDLASVIGLAPIDNFFVLEDTKKIGTRASFGFELARGVSKNQIVLTGIEYAISGYDYEYTLFGPDSELTATGAYRYDFIGLPVGYRWLRPQKKWKFFVQGSIIPMAYLRTITSSRIIEFGGFDSGRETRSERNEDFQTFHLAASTAIGVQRSIFNNWVIGLQPTFRIHLTSITTGEFSERPWTAGLQLNIGRFLGKDTKK